MEANRINDRDAVQAGAAGQGACRPFSFVQAVRDAGEPLDSEAWLLFLPQAAYRAARLDAIRDAALMRVIEGHRNGNADFCIASYVEHVLPIVEGRPV